MYPRPLGEHEKHLPAQHISLALVLQLSLLPVAYLPPALVAAKTRTQRVTAATKVDGSTRPSVASIKTM